MSRQTLQEKYFSINAALNRYIKSYSLRCPVIKCGVDPATLKDSARDQTSARARYPYLQSHLMNVNPTAWTSDRSGIYTRFEYQLSFFTSPDTEIENDSELFKPFDVARMALSDINTGALLLVDETTGAQSSIADLLSIREERNFSMVSGAAVPRAVLVAKLATVCGYPVRTPDPGISTDLEDAISILGE